MAKGRTSSCQLSVVLWDIQPISSKKLSPSKPFFHLPHISSLSSHWHLHFAIFCPLKGPCSQIDCALCGVKSVWGTLAVFVLHSTLSSSMALQVTICYLVFVFTLEEMFVNIAGQPTAKISFFHFSLLSSTQLASGIWSSTKYANTHCIFSLVIFRSITSGSRRLRS